MGGALYVVATPIGHMKDITERAKDTLAGVDRVLAEDTRRTRALLSHLGIGGKPVDRLDAHATADDVARAVGRLEAGESLALVTDAGTPVVSDPGGALVRAAAQAGLQVVPIPGASAVLAALAACGLPGDGGFRFLGFLPREGSARQAALGTAAATPEQVVLFEAPGRVQRTLSELAEATPSREVCVARELTKLHEELVRGTLARLAEDTREWIGEVVIVLGAYDPASREAEIDDAAIDRRIDLELAQGLHVKSIAERVAAWSGRKKREIYERVVARKPRG